MYFLRQQHRVKPFATINISRNLRVLHNIMINVVIMSVAGAPSFVITVCILAGQITDETVIYCNLFTLFGVVLITVTSFSLTKNAKKTFVNLIQCLK
ncbi:unnamed protein product [Adineta steineri]|uniref:Uncharacterized protein n=1 Tax=Adineta steineri TaxID=433720 RepID=A0A814UDW5_9BILA|nr:unnamed protein product [Adineta steineri]CAF1404260.1 unnamed protein product [Adineta steineri]